MVNGTFSTFCHISQYGESGYRSLPRMVAMSRTCLWAPSGAMLRSEQSGLSANAFLRYVEEGEIRIFGRHEWIYEPAWRNTQRWPGTEWDPGIDDKIRRISDEDASKPKAERRVIVVPPEQGYEFADAYLDENPAEISRWWSILRDPRKRKAIPGGTREAALENINEPRLAARRILRDAYNHGQAISYSEADAPVLLQQVHRDFLRILSDAPAYASDGPGYGGIAVLASAVTQQTTNLRLGSVTDQLLEILAELDIHARNRGDVDSLDRLIHRPGREDLMH